MKAIFYIGQTVWIPKDKHGNNRMGVVVDSSPRSNAQSGLNTGRDKAKVRYSDGNGGVSEQWFDYDKLELVKETRKPNKSEQDKEKQAMLEAESKKPREKADWIGQGATSNVIKGVNTAGSHATEDFIG